MCDLWQHRLTGAWLWVRTPAALPRRPLPASPMAVYWYIPKPCAHAEAGRTASHQLMLWLPAITHFSIMAQQPQPLPCTLSSRLGFQIYISCSISNTRHQSPLTLLVFKTSFNICMWAVLSLVVVPRNYGRFKSFQHNYFPECFLLAEK